MGCGCCCFGCFGPCTGTCYSCTVSCTDQLCGGCVTGPSCSFGTPCIPCSSSPCNPGYCCTQNLTGVTAGIPCCIGLCQNLPLTNPSAGINTSLDPLTSPCSSGATDNPPSPISGGSTSVPIGAKKNVNVGGSGAGTANQKLGGISIPRLTGAPIATSNPLNTLGSAIASLFGGQAATALAKKNASNAVRNAAPIVTSSSFTIVILVVGALMLFLAFSKGE